MADNLILADTSILIDYFRKTDKANSVWIALYDQGYDFSISAITHYESHSVATAAQLSFWQNVLQRTAILPFAETVANVAVEINNSLKRTRKQIAMADLFIAATTISNNLPLATLNRKHFDRIDRLDIIE